MAALNESGVKSLLEHLQGDFKAISGEAKKKLPAVKEAAERGFIRIRNINSNDEAIKVLTSTDDIIHPLLFACESKGPKIVQLSLGSLQRLITHKAIAKSCLEAIVGTLWMLAEADVESLKVLQTILLLVTTTEIVGGQHLAKIVLLCLHLYSSKEAVISNTASAAIRQTVSAVFEHLKFHLDDEGFFDVPETQDNSTNNYKALEKLNPKAHDAYLLFQDIVQLTNGDPSTWLPANLEMSKALGLELLENILNNFPRIFLEIPEFGQMLKERICPLVIKLFSPSIKHHRTLSSSTPPPSLPPSDRPSFTISMRLLKIVAALVQQYYQRLVTECEIFLSLLVKFIDHDKPLWQRTLAIEVLHVFTAKPKLLKSFCINYDMQLHSTKVFGDIIDALGGFIQACLTAPNTPVSATSSGSHTSAVGGPGIGIAATDRTAMFTYRNISIPVLRLPSNAAHKPTLLEMLDKADAPLIHESYPLAVAYTALLDAVKSVTIAVEDLPLPSTNTHCETVTPDEVNEVMIKSSWSGMLAALSLLLNACGDEQVTEDILKAHETYVYLCGKMKLTIPRDAFITELCKGSLPPHYAFTLIAAKIPLPPAVTPASSTAGDSEDDEGGGGVTYVFGAHSNEEKGGKKGVIHHQQRNDSSGGDGGKHAGKGGHMATRPHGIIPIQESAHYVEITAKNLQYMRTLLNLAHCHGDILTSSWKLVLTTLQHLSTLLGLRAQQDGSLKPSGTSTSDSTNLTLPSSPGKKSELLSICNLLSRLFESSRYISEESLLMLVDAICQLSAGNIKNSKNTNLFAIAKLLETGLCNMERINVVWKPMTSHILEICECSDVTTRLYAADSLTMLVRVILSKNQEIDKKEELNTLQLLLISPLLSLTSNQYTDVRLKQLECVQQVLQLCGQSLSQSWSLVLQIIAITSNSHNELLIRSGFQGLQLIVTDFLPSLPALCLPVCIAVAGQYGVQNEDLNISLTSIGLLWNIADFLFQNKSVVVQSLDGIAAASSSSEDSSDNLHSTVGIDITSIDQFEITKAQSLLSQFNDTLPPFDTLWMLLFLNLTTLCVDDRPAVRKSASHTLFSTVMAHGPLLQLDTWPDVLWKILFPLLTKVNSLAGSASTSSQAGSIMMHHSRDTAHKQWAETQVLILTGVARLFQSRRKALSTLDCFFNVWTTFLDYVKICACNCTEEVAIAAVDSLYKTLDLSKKLTKRSSNGSMLLSRNASRSSIAELPPAPAVASDGYRKISLVMMPEDSDDSLADYSQETITSSQIELYAATWKIWASIGKATIIDRVVVGARVEDLLAANVSDTSDKVRALELLVPSQQYMVTYFNCFPLLIVRLRENFTTEDFHMLSDIVTAALRMPVPRDTSPFLVPPFQEYAISSVQDAVLRAVVSLYTYNPKLPKTWLESSSGGRPKITETLKVEASSLPLCPAILRELLSYVQWSCTEPPKPSGNKKYFFLLVGYTAFSQAALQLAYDLYMSHPECPVILEGESIAEFLKALHLPLKQKCSCPSPVLWKQSLDVLIDMLHTGLPLGWEHGTHTEEMWNELGSVLEDFLFASSTQHQPAEVQQELEVFDVKVINLIKKDILPHCSKTPESFQNSLTSILNKGSIHTATDVLSGDDAVNICFRENFARACFEALLQFSFISSKESNIDATSQVALNALLERSREVLLQFTKDEALAGGCPLPRARVNEVSLVLKSITVLINTLRSAQQDPSIKVDHKVWQNIIELYLPLVECVTCNSTDVRKDLQSTLVEFSHLLSITS